MRELVICGLIFFALTGNLNAENPVEQAGESIQANSSDVAESHSLQSQKDELLGLLAQVDERYGDVAASLKTIEEEISKSNQSLDKLRTEIGSYQTDVAKLDKELAGQVKAAYAMGQQERLKLMLNQQDPALSSRMMIYYEYVNKARMEKLAYLQNYIKYLDQLNKDKQLETDSLEKNLDQKKAEQKILADVKKQRDDLIRKLNNDLSSEEEQLSLLKESENKLIDLIKSLEHDTGEIEQAAVTEREEDSLPSDSNENFPKLTGEFRSLKGKLPFPVRGKLASMLPDPASEAMWKGVLINAKEGAEIRSVTKGRVAYAGTLKGYGLLLIIEHDQDYMSLYAFNQSIYKRKGDSVAAGEIIAAVGQSGGRNQPGLYFEIRERGKPVNPLMWCQN
jgi:septal ring factor EnvC (AmiA/AmiB activator)